MQSMVGVPVVVEVEATMVVVGMALPTEEAEEGILIDGEFVICHIHVQ